VESLEFKSKVLNIVGMPAIVACTGIGLALARRRRTAAR